MGIFPSGFQLPASSAGKLFLSLTLLTSKFVFQFSAKVSVTSSQESSLPHHPDLVQCPGYILPDMYFLL